MDLFTILGATLRRWYVALPVIALAAFAAWYSYHAMPSVYSSSVSVTVLAPVQAPEYDAEGEVIEPFEANPYSGPNLAASVLARNLNSGLFHDRLGMEDVTLEADAASRDPIIEIVATAPTPQAVTTALNQVTAEASVVLDAFQSEAGATDGARYRLALAVPADAVEDVTPSRFRTAGAIAVIGLGLAAALATALDMGLEMRRTTASSKRRAHRGTSSVGSAPPHPADSDEPATLPPGGPMTPTHDAPEAAAPEEPTPQNAAPEEPTPQNAAPDEPTPQTATPDDPPQNAAPDEPTPQTATPDDPPHNATPDEPTPQTAAPDGGSVPSTSDHASSSTEAEADPPAEKVTAPAEDSHSAVLSRP